MSIRYIEPFQKEDSIMPLNDIDIRKTAPSQSRWSFDKEPLQGLREHVQNNQPLMALEYVLRLFNVQEQRIFILETEVANLIAEKDKNSNIAVVEKPSSSSRGTKAKTEEAKAED